MAKEKLLEARLVKEVKRRGGEAVKWISPAQGGLPDRIVLIPGGCVRFVETKTTGKKLDPLQRIWREKLEKMGFEYHVIDSNEALINFLEKL